MTSNLGSMCKTYASSWHDRSRSIQVHNTCYKIMYRDNDDLHALSVDLFLLRLRRIFVLMADQEGAAPKQTSGF